MGISGSWYWRLLQTGREAVSDTKWCSDGNWLDLDKMVLRYQAKKSSVRFAHALAMLDLTANNCSLAAVNACLACVGLVQCARILMYEKSKTGSTAGVIKELEGETKDVLKKAETDVKKAIK